MSPPPVRRADRRAFFRGQAWGFWGAALVLVGVWLAHRSNCSSLIPAAGMLVAGGFIAYLEGRAG